MRLRKQHGYRQKLSSATESMCNIHNKYTIRTSLLAVCGIILYSTIRLHDYSVPQHQQNNHQQEEVWNHFVLDYSVPRHQQHHHQQYHDHQQEQQHNQQHNQQGPNNDQQQEQQHNQQQQQGPNDGDVFEPGSLDYNRLETLRKCYVDPIRYQDHFPGPSDIQCTTSETHKIVYRMIGKSGSSSARLTLEHKFNALKERENCRLHDDDLEYHKLSFVRDPFSRFISAFRQELQVGYRKRNEFSHVKRKMKKRHLENHNMTVRALETYVDSYNGIGKNIGHLRLQVTKLLPQRVMNYDAIYDMTDMEDVFKILLHSRSPNSTYHDDSIAVNDAPTDVAIDTAANNTQNTTTVSHKRKLRIDTSVIALQTKIKICQLSALDFCCLNYELPPECRGHVKCRWTQRPSSSKSSSSLVLAIEAISPHPPPKNSDKYRKKEREGLKLKMNAAIRTFSS